MKELERACKDVLLDNLPVGLKAEVDRLLARGVSKDALLQIISGMAKRAGGGNGTKGELTILAVKAYLETK